MRPVTADAHPTSTRDEQARAAGILRTYLFSPDHKMIGLQLLFSALLWCVAGGFLALGIRWQLAFPWRPMPLLGEWLASPEGGQIAPEHYTMLVTMHASIMIFFVMIPVLVGVFGSFLIPLMIGADDMAFPVFNRLRFWFLWPAFLLMGMSFFVAGGAAHGGWTSYPPLSMIQAEAPGSWNGQTLWLMGLAMVGISLMMGSINDMTTILQMRAPGMTMFRLPMTIWGMFITAILQAIAWPVLMAVIFMQMSDRMLGTFFFLPSGAISGNAAMASGGSPLLPWEPLFWCLPAVCLMILPAIGMVSDMLSCFARKPLFGYKPLIYSISGLGGLGLIVWGYHLLVSGMHGTLGMTFMVSTRMIALPGVIIAFSWLGTFWGGKIQFTTPMLFAMSFVLMFVLGGLSGIFMGAAPVDVLVHNTCFAVAHFHYVLFCAAAMGALGGIYYWFPKMFGRRMNDSWGKIHFVMTFILMNGAFYPMYILGMKDFPRRVADPYYYDTFRNLLELNQFMSYGAFLLAGFQVVFLANFFWSMFLGPPAGRNPWNANGLEWQTPSPPGYGNFDFQPVVYRTPYEYGSSEVEEDYYPQTQPPPVVR